MTGVSRSGRVRKKSSKLMDFQSPDDIETTKAQKRTSHKSPSTKTLHTSQRSSMGTIKSYFQPIPKPNYDLPPLKTSQTNQSAFSAKSPAIINSNRRNSIGNSIAAQMKKDERIIDAEKELNVLAERLLSPRKYDDDDGMYDDDENDNNNDIESDEEFDYEEIDTTMRKSAYMSEKRRKEYKDGEIVLSRMHRKDRGKPRLTAYKFKNKRPLKVGQPSTFLNKPSLKKKKKPGRKPKNSVADMAQLQSPIKKPKIDRKSNISAKKIDHIVPSTSAKLLSPSSSFSLTKQRTTSNSSSSNFSGQLLPNAYKVTGIGPMDVAAHLKLLGDNLTIIGQRLKEHEVKSMNIIIIIHHMIDKTKFRFTYQFVILCLQGQITVSGSLSVLLDSLLCSLAPLMCLTTLVPQIVPADDESGHLKETLVNILDNIAYVMPGL